MLIQIPDPVQSGVWIELSQCVLRPDARFHTDDDIAILAQGMTIKQLQSIAVCRVPGTDGQPDRYEVIFGGGRVLGGRKNQWEKIRADIYENLTELQKLQMVFAENEDRRNASPLYQAQLLQQMSLAEPEPLLQADLAERLGKDQSTVSLYLSLLKLSPQLLNAKNAFTAFGMRHFKALFKVEDPGDQYHFAEVAREKGLSAAQLSDLIDEHLGRPTIAKKEGRPKGSKTKSPEAFQFARQKSTLRIKAQCDLNQDIDAFLAQLKTALFAWRESHPIKPVS